MKKIIILFLIPLILTGIISCTKTGPAGPVGATGPTGPAGSSVVAIDTFTVLSTSWVMTSTGYYKYVRTNTNITKSIVDIGTVDVYAWTASYPDWYAWPETVAGAGQAGYRYFYNLNTLTLLADNFPSGPPTNKIKVVIRK